MLLAQLLLLLVHLCLIIRSNYLNVFPNKDKPAERKYDEPSQRVSPSPGTVDVAFQTEAYILYVIKIS